MSSVVRFIREQCYDNYIKKDHGDIEEEGESLLEDVAQLEVVAMRFDSVEKFMAHVKKMQKVGKKSEDKAVVLTTVHRVKGLERSYVYGIGISSGLLPHARSIGIANSGKEEILSPYFQDTEDERCIFFVMVTRAQSELYLSSIRSYNGRFMEPSPFLEEVGLIKKDCIDEQEHKYMCETCKLGLDSIDDIEDHMGTTHAGNFDLVTIRGLD